MMTSHLPTHVHVQSIIAHLVENDYPQLGSLQMIKHSLPQVDQAVSDKSHIVSADAVIWDGFTAQGLQKVTVSINFARQRLVPGIKLREL